MTDDDILYDFNWLAAHEIRLVIPGPIDPKLFASFAGLERTYDVVEKREYNRDEPVALDDRDPGNTDPSELTAPLAPDDDVLTLVYQDQGDIRETAPMQNPSRDPS